MTLDNTKNDWEDLAKLDPLWAILTYPERKYGKWNVDEFFLSGENEINNLLKKTKQLGVPHQFKVALDFGCGVGRISRGLAKIFEKCYGVDISEYMIMQAKDYNKSIGNCEFLVNTEKRLTMFENDYFDLIYTKLVLQHISDKEIIKFYIKEFVRTLKNNGLLIFQIPVHLSFKNRLQPRRRIFSILKAIGFNRSFLFNKLGVYPMVMNFVSELEIKNLLEELGANILEICSNSDAGAKVASRTFCVTK